ncbi:MFS transporter [Brachybacterium huguangmaarense]
MDLTLLRHRPLARGLGVLTLFGAAYFGAMSILPLHVKGVRGGTALDAGMVMLPQAIGVGASIQVATRLVDRVPPGRVVTTGLATAGIGSLALLATMAGSGGVGRLIPGAVLVGIGSGATIMPTMTASLRDLQGELMPRGTAVLALVQQLASALGVATMGTMLTLGLTIAVPDLAGGGSVASRMLALGGAERAHLLPELARSFALPAGLMVALILAALALSVRGRGAPADRRRSL